MAVDVTHTVISYATIWYAPVGETPPDLDTVEWGADWGGGWVDVGATLEGAALAYSRDIFELDIQQLTSHVKRRKTSQVFAFEGVIGEFKADNLKLLLGGTIATQAAGAGVKESEILTVKDDTTLDEYAWGMEALHDAAGGTQQPIRILFARGNATLNGNLQFAKNAGAGMPIRVDGLPDMSTNPPTLITIQRATAPATA